jgi:hypothetical protein
MDDTNPVPFRLLLCYPKYNFFIYLFGVINMNIFLYINLVKLIIVYVM